MPNHNKRRESTGLKPGFLCKNWRTTLFPSEKMASVVLIIICSMALIWLFLYPEIPIAFKEKTSLFLKKLDKFFSLSFYPDEGLIIRKFGRSTSTIIWEMIFTFIFFCIGNAIVLLLFPLEFIIPSIARITPYALPVLIIVTELEKLLPKRKYRKKVRWNKWRSS